MYWFHFIYFFFFLLELLLYGNWTPNPSFTCFILFSLILLLHFVIPDSQRVPWIDFLFTNSFFSPSGDSFLLFTTYDKFCFVLFFSAIMFFYCQKKVHGLRMLFLVSLFSFSLWMYISLKNKLRIFRSFMFPILLLF